MHYVEVMPVKRWDKVSKDIIKFAKRDLQQRGLTLGEFLKTHLHAPVLKYTPSTLLLCSLFCVSYLFLPCWGLCVILGYDSYVYYSSLHRTHTHPCTRLTHTFSLLYSESLIPLSGAYTLSRTYGRMSRSFSLVVSQGL